MPDWMLPCHTSGIWKHQITRKMLLFFWFDTIFQTCISTGALWSWACALALCHGSNGKSFIDKNFFLEKDSQDQQAHCYTSYPHISHRPEKKGTPTLCCNFTQPPSAFIWSVTSEIIHQPQLLSDPLILFLSLTLFLCRHKELKGERLSFFLSDATLRRRVLLWLQREQKEV